VELAVNPDGTATGRFLPHWAGFMWLRHTPDIPPPEPPLWLDDEPVESITRLDPAPIPSDSLVSFVAQWHLPDVTWGPTTENGTPATHLWAPDRSRASACSSPTTGGFPVSQAGPSDCGTGSRIAGGQIPSSTHRHHEVAIGDVIDERLHLAEAINTGLVDVKTDDVETDLDRSNSDRQAHVALTDHNNTA
jgi:hypothetical protein